MRVLLIEAAQCRARECEFHLMTRGLLAELLEYTKVLGVPSLRLGLDFANGDALLVDRRELVHGDRFRVRLDGRTHSMWFWHFGILIGRRGPTELVSSETNLGALNALLEFDWSLRRPA